MSGALAVLRRELLATFCSTRAWAVLALFLLVQGYAFYLLVELAAQPQPPLGSVLVHFFGGTFFFWLFLIVVISAITMRLLAEERRSGTLEALMTAPVAEAAVVLGKYAAAVVFYVFLWTPTLLYTGIIRALSTEGAVCWGTLGSAYFGTMLVGAACLAIGMLGSALCRSQLLAALLTFTALTLLLLLGPAAAFLREPWMRAVFEHVNLFEHMDAFARGIVDTRHLVFHLSVIVFCLAAASKVLEARKWR